MVCSLSFYGGILVGIGLLLALALIAFMFVFIKNN